MDQQLFIDRLNMLAKNTDMEFVFDGEDTVLRVRAPIFTLNITIPEDQLETCRENITEDFESWLTMKRMG